VIVGLAAALGAAVAFGVAAVLQAVAARRTHSASTLDPRLLLRLLRHPTFALALVLNGVGFALHVVALQDLPLFLVQSAIAGSVAVTAVLAAVVLEVPMGARSWAAVGAVCAGLALLASGAQDGAASDPGGGLRVALALVLVAVGALGVAAGRASGPVGAAALGLLGGVGFAVVAVAARLLHDLTPATLVGDPLTYVLLVAGALAFLLYSTGMQRASVTTATAALVVTQTAVPAAVGVVLLGDQVRSGAGPVAAAGFVVALAGALALARFEALEV
jgi:drug/metabolite transporter (DMT)-like permease